MADQQSSGKAAGGSGAGSSGSGKTIVRAVVGLVLVAAIAAAGMDYMQKKQFEATQAAFTKELDAKEGVPVAELPSVVQGSPKVEGDLLNDQNVTYTWGVIRSYKMTVRLDGDAAKRAVTAFESALD